MTFKEYLSALRPSADARGDLKRLAAADSFPDIATRDQLRAYIVSRQGEGVVADAADDCWKTYQAAERRASKAERSHR